MIPFRSKTFYIVNMVSLGKFVAHLLFLNLYIHSIVTVDHDNVARLKKKILTNYSVRVRPVMDRKQAMEISAKMHIFHIDKVNEKDQSVRIHGLMQMSWKDEFLTWNNTLYNDTKYILMRNYEIWTPNIVIANSAKLTPTSYVWNLPIKVWYVGFIYASPEFSTDVSCNFDFSNYPYDEQTCTMGLYASGLAMSEIKWAKFTDPELRMYWPAAQNKTQISKWVFYQSEFSRKYWTYQGLSSIQPNQSESRWVLPIMEVVLRFKRNDIYFGMTIVLPAVLTSMITVFAMCPFIKIKLGLFLLMINFVIQCFYVDNLTDTIPLTVNGIPKIAIFYAFNMCATTLGIILRVVFLFMQTQKDIRDSTLKKAVEEQMNQERLPQVAETPKPNTLLDIFEPKKYYYIIVVLYVFAYILCAVLNLS